MLLFRAAFAFSKAAAAVERGAARQVHAEELLDRGKEPSCWYSMGQAFPGTAVERVLTFSRLLVCYPCSTYRDRMRLYGVCDTYMCMLLETIESFVFEPSAGVYYGSTSLETVS